MCRLFKVLVQPNVSFGRRFHLETNAVFVPTCIICHLSKSRAVQVHLKPLPLVTPRAQSSFYGSASLGIRNAFRAEFKRGKDNNNLLMNTQLLHHHLLKSTSHPKCHQSPLKFADGLRLEQTNTSHRQNVPGGGCC